MKVPFLVDNDYIVHAIEPVLRSSLPPARFRAGKHVFKDIQVDSGTGPDLIPSRVLKMCSCAGFPFNFNSSAYSCDWRLAEKLD